MMETKEFTDLMKFVLAIPSGGAVLFLSVKLIISYWFKKNTEIENLKAELKNKELESIKEKMRALEHTIENNIKKTEMLQITQNNTNSTQRNLTQNLNDTVRQFGTFADQTSAILAEFSRITDQRMAGLEEFNNELRTKLKTNTTKTELIKLGKDSIMVKTKNDE